MSPHVVLVLPSHLATAGASCPIKTDPRPTLDVGIGGLIPKLFPEHRGDYMPVLPCRGLDALGAQRWAPGAQRCSRAGAQCHGEGDERITEPRLLGPSLSQAIPAGVSPRHSYTGIQH